MESNLHLQIKCAPPPVSRPRCVTRGEAQRGSGNGNWGWAARGGGGGWIIVMKRRGRQTGMVTARAARVKSSGGFCCVLIVRWLSIALSSIPRCFAIQATIWNPLPSSTINGSFAENSWLFVELFSFLFFFLKMCIKVWDFSSRTLHLFPVLSLNLIVIMIYLIIIL